MAPEVAVAPDAVLQNGNGCDFDALIPNTIKYIIVLETTLAGR